MAQEIYNEGRVVGLSAWELYMREALGEGISPDKIPNERQWLASMIGSGASMILKIPTGTTKGVHDYELPAGSELSAAGVIVANPFMGTCEWDISNWAKKVTSYSSLILNNDEYAPSDNGSTVPYDEEYSDQECASVVSQFVKLTDGIVFTKYANWIPTGEDEPNKDIDPNFNTSSTVVRLYISADITSDLYVMFTGFTNKRILQGLSGHAAPDGDVSVGGSTDTEHNNWPNGGMLGPEITPWASKIVFSVPSSIYHMISSLTRTIPSDASYYIPEGGLNIDGFTIRENAVEGTIRPNSIIDFNAINLVDYFNENNVTSALLSEEILEGAFGVSDEVNAITAWYPGVTASDINSYDAKFFPPAIYAVQATDTGNQYLVPLDTAAPGTVKGFTDPDAAFNYRQKLPNNFAIYHNTDYNTFSFVTDNEYPEYWPGTAYLEYTESPKVNLTVGNVEAKLISLTDSEGNEYNTSGTDTTVPVGPTDNLNWDTLLHALANNESIDILGLQLHALGEELTEYHTIGVENTVEEVASDKLTLKALDPYYNISMMRAASGDANVIAVNGGSQAASIKVDADFIEFGSGLRLYISSSEPNGTIPAGSIGIGW